MYKISKYVTFASRRKPNNENTNLIFSGRTGKNIKLDNFIYKSLENNSLDNIPSDIFNQLRDALVIVPADEQEYQEVIRQKLDEHKKHMHSEDLYISYQPTAYCQLDCYYCGQEHKKKNIDKETIKATLERVKSKIKSHHKVLSTGWFGGEPLIALNEMRLINKELKLIANYNQLGYKSKITSNGILLTAQVYKELVEDFNLHRVEITLDGTSEYHDKRRYTKQKSPSFDKIFNNLVDIINLRKKEPSLSTCLLSIRCNVDQNNYDGVTPLLQKFKDYDLLEHVYFYVAKIHSWAQNDADQLLSTEEFAIKEIDYYIELHNLGFNIRVLPKYSVKRCMSTSAESEMYDAFGNIFDCSETSYASVYENTEFILGNVNKDNTKTLKRSCLENYYIDMEKGKFSDCTECKFLPQCSTCPKSLHEKGKSCLPFTYNFEDRMFLDYYIHNTKQL